MSKILIIFNIVIFSLSSFASQVIMDNQNAKEVQVPINIVEKDVQYNFMKENLFNYSLDEKVKGRSILFDQIQMNKLDKVMNSLIMGEIIDQEEIFDPEEEKASESKEVVASRSMKFYLDSILYNDQKHWIIWVNGKSYTNNSNANKEFEILEVNKESIKLQWVTGYNTFVYVLKQAILNNSYSDNIDIQIVDDIATVTFKLEVNQTFYLSKEVKISEGKI